MSPLLKFSNLRAEIATMRCGHCHRPIMEVVAQGQARFVLRACSRCDRQQWTIDGRLATVDEVARALRAERRSRLAPRRTAARRREALVAGLATA